MPSLIAGFLFLLSLLAAPADDSKVPAPAKDGPKPEPAKESPAPEAPKQDPSSGKAAPGPAEPTPAPAAPVPAPAKPAQPQEAVKPPPRPNFKTPQSKEKFEEGLKKMETLDYAGARAVFNSCLKDSATPDDRKILMGYIDGTKLGDEIEDAKKLVDRNEELKAIRKVERAIKTYPDGTLRPQAEKFIRETEELVYLILDDFEPGESLYRETVAREPSAPKITGDDDKGKAPAGSQRWKATQSFNSDPRFVRHGKGSMKWRTSAGASASRYYGDYGYVSLQLKNPITKWHYLVFWVFLPEADEGTLRVTLAPETSSTVLQALYTKNFIELRGKRGWMEVRLDLARDFGNTRNLTLEDVRFIRIEYVHMKARTIYLDFIHLE